MARNMASSGFVRVRVRVGGGKDETTAVLSDDEKGSSLLRLTSNRRG